MNSIFKSIIRSFINKPVITLINVIGLSISLVLVIILSTYCYSELTSDSHHINKDRIFLVSNKEKGVFMPATLKDLIDLKIPGVDASVRIVDTWNPPVFQIEEGKPIVSDMIFTDPAFFDIFTYKTIEGNTQKTFEKPMTVVITKEMARKLFGNEPAVGKTIKYNNNQSLTVTAVIEEPIGNTFLSFSALTSIETRKRIQPSESEFKEWGSFNFQVYLLLNDHTNSKDIAENIFSMFPEEYQDKKEAINLVPIEDIYFSNSRTYGISYFRMGDKNKTLVLLLVAILILVIALVNFINISSSQWLERINKTGIQKIIGASRIMILRNIITESFLFFLIAAFVAIFLVSGITPIVQNFTGTRFDIKMVMNPGYIVIVLGSILFLSILISLIPALRISSSKAIDNLNKSVDRRNKGSFFRHGLITLQFIISIVLISFTLLIFKQVKFGSDNLVFNQNNTIGIRLTKQLNKEIVKNELENYPAIKNISFTQFFPGKQFSSWGTMLNLNGEEHEVHFDTFSADEEFFKIMGIELLKGRLYSGLLQDNNKIVVNETFLKNYNLENPVGGTFEMSGGRKYEIIGVVKDFHFNSVEHPIEPLAIVNNGWASYCLATINAADFNSLHSTFKTIKEVSSKLSPEFPVEISFLDTAVNKMYESEVRFRRTFSLFAISAIVICAIGILAMSIFASQRRTKEIGVRKVNGARLTEILTMLNSDFIKWVAVAFILACPISWFAMNKWLSGFAYQTQISWWIFALAGVIAMAIALITVSWQSWRAASRNPVEALRYE